MSNSSTTSGPSTSAPSIAELTAGMQQIRQFGAGPDTKLVASDCQSYLDHIANLRTTLQGLSAKTATLVDYGNVGHQLPDAEHVRSQLMNKTDEALDAFNKIDAWLDQLWNGANAAIARFQAEDQSI